MRGVTYSSLQLKTKPAPPADQFSCCTVSMSPEKLWGQVLASLEDLPQCCTILPMSNLNLQSKNMLPLPFTVIRLYLGEFGFNIFIIISLSSCKQLLSCPLALLADSNPPAPSAQAAVHNGSSILDLDTATALRLSWT